MGDVVGPWVLGSLGPWALGSLGPWVLGQNTHMSMAGPSRRNAKNAAETKDCVVNRLCRLPVSFRARGDISMLGLLEEIGYSALSEDITHSVLEEHLRRNPELVEAWIQYSENQRCTPAFGISGPPTTDGRGEGWRVSYWDRDPENRWDRRFPDQFTAGAFLIKCNAEAWSGASMDDGGLPFRHRSDGLEP
jgi:hypothetical protein